MTPPQQNAAARVRELVDLSVDDPLAPFVLRSDKRHVFSEDGRAAVGYRLRCNVLVVGGDPVGDPLAWRSAVAGAVALAEHEHRGLAVLGAGERSRDLWLEQGLRSVSIGRDVVLRPNDFNLTGRRFRNLRQAIQRTRNAGVVVQAWTEGELPAAVREELSRMLRDQGRDRTRGFAMTLGRYFDGSQPDALIMVARDASGKAVAFQRYLRAGHKDLSLDVPVRAPGSPNGVDERLVAEAVLWAQSNGIARVSLAFAPFPDLFRKGRRTFLQAVAYRLVHVIDPLIKVERLYRFLRKFNAFDQQRFVLLRWRQVPRVALAFLLLEFGRSGSDQS